MVEGGEVTKAEVIAWINDCVENSGYGLVSDFRNLWPYTNSFTAETYPYTEGQSLKWETDTNKENMFAIKYNNYGGWDNYGLCNIYLVHFGIRGQDDITKMYPYNQGWGCGPVNPRFFEAWKQEEPNDVRLTASIMDTKDPKEGVEYHYSGDQMEATGYFQKKYMPILGKDKDGKNVGYSTLMYGTQDNFQLGHTQDLVLMRFADVLLMQSELTGTVDGLNKVRARAGLQPKTAYTLEALKAERHHELAFEGIRWFDLMRWGDVVDALNTQIGAPIKNQGKDTQMQAFGGGFEVRYKATGGFWPIPKTQIDLSEGKLTQNPGWNTDNSEYPGWSN